MIDANRYGMAGTPPATVVLDPALIRSGADRVESGSATPSGGDLAETDNSDTAALERLAQRVEAVAARLEALIDSMATLIERPAADEDAASREATSREIGAATEALIYTDFFQKAVSFGMSPNMVADAYRLADLTSVTANLETKEVVGTDVAVNALLEKRPYLFIVHQGDIGSETNPVKGPASHSEEVESLARTLGVSPEFVATLVRKRSDKVRGDATLSDIWRIPRANRLSFLETNE
jgi:hypothetical protein